MAYVPFAGKNSIVEAVLGLQFSSSLSSSVGDKFDALRSEFDKDFPRFEKLQFFQVTVGGAQVEQRMTTAPTPKVGGFNGTKVKGDGNPSRVFRAMEASLSVHFLEYDNWAELKDTALQLFERCLKVLSIPSTERTITAVALRYIDRFTFDGPSEAASAEQLLKRNTDYVAPKVHDVGNRWHSNSGWFEDLLHGETALHNLDVQGAVDSNAHVTINHNVHSNLTKPLTSLQYLRDNPNGVSIEVILNAQHDANAAVLKNMLNDGTLKDIGLGGARK